MTRNIEKLSAILALFLYAPFVSAEVLYSRSPSGAVISNPVTFHVSFENFSDFGLPPETRRYRLYFDDDMEGGPFAGACRTVPVGSFSFLETVNVAPVPYFVKGVGIDGAVGTDDPNDCDTFTQPFVYLEGNGTSIIFTIVSVRTVSIDIKPGSHPNSINLSSGGSIPVAILSSPTFDATQVDPASVSLAGAAVKLRGKGDKYACSPEDVNGDRLLDFVCHVETAQLEIEPGDSIAILEATTIDGARIRGEDLIQIVP